MLRWVEDITRHGGGGSTITYESMFFRWSHGQILMVEDDVHLGIDFIGDLDLPLPKGDQWGKIGKKYSFFYLFSFCYISFFSFFDTKMSCFTL